MQNINPTNNRNRRALFYLWLLGVPLVLGGLTACALFALLTQFPLFGSGTPIAMVCMVILSLGGIIGGGVGVYRGLTLARDNEEALHVGEYLKYHVDGRYTFIRNVSRRGLGYVDAILIGPPGALVFRIMDVSGAWRNELAEWKVKDAKGRVRSAPINPSRECARDVYALRKYFAKLQLEKVPVYGIVVFTNPNVQLTGEGSIVPISEMRFLAEILKQEDGFLADEHRLTPELARRAIASLTEG